MWVIDFEASGLHRSSYPIAVGITNGQIEYHALIQPMKHWNYWSDESERVHGLTRDALFSKGTVAAEVAKQLNALMTDQEVYCDCVSWDSFWARVLFSDNGLHQRFTLSDALPLLQSDIQIERFLAERARLQGSGFYRVHNAMDDARILWQSLTHALSTHSAF